MMSKENIKTDEEWKKELNSDEYEGSGAHD